MSASVVFVGTARGTAGIFFTSVSTEYLLNKVTSADWEKE